MKKHFKLLLLLILVLTVTQVKAQGIGFGDDVDDEPSAPINFFIPLAVAVGACLGINKLKYND